MISVCIVDDHPIARAGLKVILSETDDVVVTSEVGSAGEFFAKLNDQDWQVIILDLTLPGRGGLDILREIKERGMQSKVLVLTSQPEDQYAIRAFKAGAFGYLSKEAISTDLVAAIRQVARGEKYLSHRLADSLVESIVHETDGVPHKQLSNREFDVMRRIGIGFSVSEIADDLVLSVKTVSTYRTRILEKLNLKNSADIVRYVIQYKIV
ncbi:MAG: hypothetical protein A2504_03680 [Bdellovibrionales bacterium RIFOXYD12_FULL_39_22]|nr:MAG: hypothetical protein A2385_11430 [Bdellovibrionales bacterium RIFOXYB1_FULL_39_21]OFZ41678.1 MAG: hypothetical protein A2485_01740 [Bdellovibrionales bacterium RIFOXYC12_FULL_39_17]OFZ46078.1 MAG: hypothetical protein A2404_12105 [Bdellovibrionales bacterium RIFOXYC1_FULL_39_130]OFZ74905.1 MAG: hypothetical protein A2560_15145 [Bdellovibrionales bacterium RIFOXYD1_FULL_39_84]OFZ75408.1 MAG: hypothetical protein A2451_04320 [Bdellovibrionales bacterium RIFOXYC2_FULL_39_8]OFZ92758.1 MAG: